MDGDFRWEVAPTLFMGGDRLFLLWIVDEGYERWIEVKGYGIKIRSYRDCTRTSTVIIDGDRYHATIEKENVLEMLNANHAS